MDVELLSTLVKTLGFPAAVALFLLVERRSIRKEWRKERQEWRQSLDDHSEAIERQTRMFRQVVDAPTMRTDGGEDDSD